MVFLKNTLEEFFRKQFQPYHHTNQKDNISIYLASNQNPLLHGGNNNNNKLN
jgi:hypothetical protein